MALANRYGSFSDALSLRNALDQLFAQSFVYPNWSGQNTENALAPMNVCETDQGYRVEVAMPGVKPEDIDVNVHQNTLSIKGTFKQEQHQHGPQGQNQSGRDQNQSNQHNWLLQELRTGSFERTITFAKPIDADKITTHYEHGILTLNVPIRLEGSSQTVGAVDAGLRLSDGAAGPAQQNGPRLADRLRLPSQRRAPAAGRTALYPLAHCPLQTVAGLSLLVCAPRGEPALASRS